jgi:hypothetical protein
MFLQKFEIMALIQLQRQEQEISEEKELPT